MDFALDFKKNLFATTAQDFEARALALFRFQAKHNPVYAQYLSYLRVCPDAIHTLADIPFMPVELFKQHEVRTQPERVVECIFTSSGTTGQITARHYVSDAAWYARVCAEIFRRSYGDFSDYHILALLPAYLERQGSSLVAMADDFIRRSASAHSGFYLHNYGELMDKIRYLSAEPSRRVLLLGVTFALLDLAEQYPQPLPAHVILMETGGMKGRRREMLRAEVHQRLRDAFGVQIVHSEYGMTEMMSQAYSQGEGIYTPPAWVRILLRDMHDPRDMQPTRQHGVVNVIDLANVDSCAFLATQDIGTRLNEHQFSILGRTDHSDIRGCNLMVL